LKQVPAENLPTAFGGTCDCPGGCQLSDAGPWQDPQWVKEPAWAKKKDTNAIDNTQLPGPTEGTTAVAPPIASEPAAAPAPAPAPAPAAI